MEELKQDGPGAQSEKQKQKQKQGRHTIKQGSAPNHHVKTTLEPTARGPHSPHQKEK